MSIDSWEGLIGPSLVALRAAPNNMVCAFRLSSITGSLSFTVRMMPCLGFSQKGHFRCNALSEAP